MSSNTSGLVVPIPTLPVLLILIFSVAASDVAVLKTKAAVFAVSVKSASATAETEAATNLASPSVPSPSLSATHSMTPKSSVSLTVVSPVANLIIGSADALP